MNHTSQCPQAHHMSGFVPVDLRNSPAEQSSQSALCPLQNQRSVGVSVPAGLLPLRCRLPRWGACRAAHGIGPRGCSCHRGREPCSCKLLAPPAAVRFCRHGGCQGWGAAERRASTRLEECVLVGPVDLRAFTHCPWCQAMYLAYPLLQASGNMSHSLTAPGIGQCAT
jgi:hypothetical protein